MPADRFYISSTLHSGLEVVLDGTEFHHLAHVMRLKENETVDLVNGQGVLAKAQIRQISKKQAHLIIDTCYQEQRPNKEKILAQAIPRINRLDLIIEKGTELGATHFWLFPGMHSERKQITDHQIERLQAMSIAAMKQCGSLFLPTIEIKPTLTAWKALSFPAYFGDLDKDAPPFLSLLNPNESVLFFVGPESGFAEQEIEKLIEIGAKGVKLHENILRTETAALVALSLMSVYTGSS